MPFSLGKAALGIYAAGMATAAAWCLLRLDEGPWGSALLTSLLWPVSLVIGVSDTILERRRRKCSNR